METQTKVNTTASWDDTNSGEFYKFESGKRVTVALQHWRLTWVEEENKDAKKMQTRIEIYANVIGENGKLISKILKMTSKRLIVALKPHLAGLNPTEITFLSVKRIGEGTDTQYDVEKAQPTVLQ